MARLFEISKCTYVQQDFYFHNHVYGIVSIHFQTVWYSQKGENNIYNVSYMVCVNHMSLPMVFLCEYGSLSLTCYLICP